MILKNLKIHLTFFQSQNVDKNFDVQDYVVPTYSVTIDAPSQVAFSDSKFGVKITPEYTYGQIVEGVAVVTFSRVIYRFFGGPIALIARPIGPIFGGPSTTVLYTRTIDINSQSVSFQVDIEKDLGITQATYDNVQVKVDFTEKVTKKVVSANTNIQIVPYAYSISFTDDGTINSAYEPNTELKLKLSIAKSDGTPVKIHSY